MTVLVVDASVVIKWVIEEEGTDQALALQGWARFLAPDLLVAECANILWKKVRLAELTRDEALVAARILQAARIELLPTRNLLEAATRIAIELGHPAYDCLYLALAVEHDSRFITADTRLLRALAARSHPLATKAIALNDAAATLSP